MQLIDQYLRKVNYLRVSVTDRCDLRCVYCMKEKMQFLPRKDILTLEEIERLCDNFIELGVEKIRLTGGEPLVRNDIIKLIEKLNTKKEKTNLKEITLTTNGTLLKKYAKLLKLNGINRINVSLDTINPEKYNKITRFGNIEKVFDGINEALDNNIKIKINTVVIKDFNENEIELKSKEEEELVEVVEVDTNKVNTDISAFSLSSLKVKKKVNDEIKKIEDSKEKENQDLDLNNLKEKWNLYSNELEKKGKGNFSSLLTLNEPTIEDKIKIVYNVPTKSSKKELIEIKEDLSRFLKSSLKNDYLVLKFEVNNDVNKEFFLTPKEKYEKLKEINPTIEKLKIDLKLDF